MDSTALAKTVADLVEDHYVFVESAVKFAAKLRQLSDAGRYAGLDDRTLADAITSDLRGESGDLHLRVVHHPAGVGKLQAPLEYAAYWGERARLTAGGIRSIERRDGNVAVLQLGPVLSPAAFAVRYVHAALSIASDADSLILDVRGCLGGVPETVAMICSYLFDDEPVHLNDQHSRANGVRQYWTVSVAAPDRYGREKPVAVLTSAETFSGGEELAYVLQQLGRAEIVGETTRGGAHPRVGITVSDHLEVAIPVARPVHPLTRGNWEGVGVKPDHPVPADDALEAAVSSLRRS